MSNAEQSEVAVSSSEISESLREQEPDYKALYEETQKKLEVVASHKDKLYQETKKAKADREQAEVARQKADEEKAQKDGEYEKLWQTAKKEKDELMQNLQQYKQSIRNEKLQATAMRVATELADGDNAELLSEFVVRNLDKMADETGALSADVLEAVRDEFKSNNKYKALLRGSKAAGGGAPGNAKGTVENNKTVDRATFESWEPNKKMKFVRDGGKFE